MTETDGSSPGGLVVCGAGAIGAATAWFLAGRGVQVTVVERHEPAGAASGKSGGFLAADWCDGTPLQALARRSFALHAELPGRVGRDWGYRRVDTLAVGPGRRTGHEPAWLGPGFATLGVLGDRGSTAQVDPAAFTRALLGAALALGARLVAGRVEGLLRGGDRLEAVIVDGRPLRADAVVLALGPWTHLASGWLPLPRVGALAGHSLLFRPTVPLGAQALFVSDGSGDTPELFPRADGTVYLCGRSTMTPLPDDPAAVRPDPRAIAELRALAPRLAPALADAPLLAAQVCHRPVTADHLPLIGPVPGRRNAYVATGHGPWGILNAPATGEALAELILDGTPRHVDLRPFDPARLAAA